MSVEFSLGRRTRFVSHIEAEPLGIAIRYFAARVSCPLAKKRG